jgi:hypothetical protein
MQAALDLLVMVSSTLLPCGMLLVAQGKQQQDCSPCASLFTGKELRGFFLYLPVKRVEDEIWHLCIVSRHTGAGPHRF